MKVKVSDEVINQILANPKAVKDAKIEVSDPWWVIALKVLAYLIGLLLAGVGTAEAATMVGMM